MANKLARPSVKVMGQLMVGAMEPVLVSVLGPPKGVAMVGAWGEAKASVMGTQKVMPTVGATVTQWESE